MNEAEARRLVQLRASAGQPSYPSVCEGCGTARGESFAHRVRRSQGGPWSPENGLRLCGSGTTGCHGWSSANPDAAKDLGWELRADEVDLLADRPALIHAAALYLAWWVLLPDGCYRWDRDPTEQERLLLPAARTMGA